MKKKYTVTWDEYLTCRTTVEAESKKEAKEKFFNDQHGEVDEETESCDNLEIYEADDDDGEEGARELKPDSGQCNSECKSVENDKALSGNGGEKPTSPPYSQELKGGG